MAGFIPSIFFYSTVFSIVLDHAFGHAAKHCDVMEVRIPGDFIITGIFNIHEGVDKSRDTFEPKPSECIRFQERGITRSLMMISAIERMNQSPQLRNVNITLGYNIFDSCSDASTALRVTDLFLHNTSHPTMAVIGGSISEISIAIARQLTLKMLPQISYSSTAVVLSDKSRYPAFMRTIPNDKHQTAAMASLCSINGWNWVGIIITDGDYGRSALDQFVTQANERGICIAFKLVVPQSVSSAEVSSEIQHSASTILGNPKVQVIVSFCKSAHTGYLFEEMKTQVLQAGKSTESMRRIWLASDSWATSTYLIRDLSLTDIGHVVGFSYKSGDTSTVVEYMDKLENSAHDAAKSNPFLQEYFRLYAAKGLGESDAVKLLKEHVYGDIVFSIEMAVSAITKAFASICKSRDCKKPDSVQPWEVLKALWMEEFMLKGKTYKFDSSGDINLGYDVMKWWSEGNNTYGYDIVAEYHPVTSTFTYVSNPVTQEFFDLKNVISKCSNSCVPGEFKKTAEGQHTCCYECINCTENYYSNATDMDQCLGCNISKEWSAEGSSSCTPKQLLYFSWQDGFAIVLVSFAALGIFLTLMVSALFLHQRNTPVVKAAGGPLSQVILFSLVISNVSAILFVGRPNTLQCKARQVLFGISFTLCVSCILVKSLQILLAFQFNPALQHVLRKLFQPYVIVSLCVAGQAIICICWLVLERPFNQVILQPSTLLEDCNEGSYLCFALMLGYIALLASVCFICAFKGRKLPEYYNEAKFITFSMLLYLISWMLFIPVYVTTTGVYLSAVEMVVILMSNYGILCCHFFTKCYVILFKKEQNTQTAFRQNLYEYSSKSSMSLSDSANPVPEKKPGDINFISASSLTVPVHCPEEAGDMTRSRGVVRRNVVRRSSI